MPHPQLDNLVRSGDLKAEPGEIEYEGLWDVDEQLLNAVLRVTRLVAERVSELGPV